MFRAFILALQNPEHAPGFVLRVIVGESQDRQRGSNFAREQQQVVNRTGSDLIVPLVRRWNGALFCGPTKHVADGK